MVPPKSVEFTPLNETASGAVPETGAAEIMAWGTEPADFGSTNSVTLNAGSVALRAPPLYGTSARRVMAFADVSCHICEVPDAGKLPRLSVIGVLPERYLLIAKTVSAPSLDRCAANAAT